MDLMQITERDYLYLESGMSVSQARSLLEAARASRAILHHPGPPPLYYLYIAAELASRLLPLDGAASLDQALDLLEADAAPTADSASFVDDAPDVCVVLEGSRLLGYVDLTQSPEENVRLDDGDSTSPPVLERYLAVEFPNRLATGETAQLDVYLVALGFGGKGKAIQQPAGTQIRIEVLARSGLEPLGEVEGTLVVTEAEEGERLPFNFKAARAGMGELIVLAFLQGIEVSRVRVICQIKDAAPAGQAVVHQGAIETRLYSVPDLTVHIEQTGAADHVEFIFTISSPDPMMNLNLARYGPHAMGPKPREYFDEFYQGIEDLPLETPADFLVADVELKSRGAELFTRMLPPEMQKLMVSLRHRIRTVFVQSSEPWVPWELCRLPGGSDGHPQEGEFFCEAFEITRWIPGTGLRQSLRLDNMAVVVPQESSLPAASLELDYLQTLAGGDRTVSRIPARFKELHNAFKSGVYNAWHFSGHGAGQAANPNRAEIVLEDGAYRAQYVGGEIDLRASQPLVFLNACQIGRGGASFAGQGGWAYQFLQAGAGAFIGALWSVTDEPAYRFARELYTRLLAGDAFGAAVRQSRLAIKQEGDPTWLAYTAFAYPFAKVV